MNGKLTGNGGSVMSEFSGRRRNREARIALVLYGGVSLAVYENGITRTFHDFVREQGPWPLMGELLDANATVDVVAGTSAGGINGLMLAAALESGASFEACANLWRKKGDFGLLLRPYQDAADAESLLAGETYYQSELVSAFKALCHKSDPDYQSPSAMDVFITGTDLDGTVKTYRDALGNRIEDKEYRTVFHLKHRPGRKTLGLATTEPHSTEAQAHILASVARITSSFPGAFPPFQIKQVAEPHRKAVRQALSRTSNIAGTPDRVYVDGGVLDNKPFGHALNAIFHRVPISPVSRRLFYLEPSPQTYSPQITTPEHSPVNVIISCLTSIPAHESIGDDLNRLIAHNARIRWLKELKEDLQTRIAANPRNKVQIDDFTPQYVLTRLQSLAISLVHQSTTAPFAAHIIDDVTTRERYDALLSWGRSKLNLPGTGSSPSPATNVATMSLVDDMDIAFQMRRAYHYLYLFANKMSDASTPEAFAYEIWAIGRIIITLKLIRDMLLYVRDKLLARADAAGTDSADFATLVMEEYLEFLSAAKPHWQAIIPSLAFDFKITELRKLKIEFLNRDQLSQTADAIYQLSRAYAAGSDPTAAPAQGKTILGVIGDTLNRVIDMGRLDVGKMVWFRALDEQTYPLLFASDTYEWDEIPFIRISPFDASGGLAGEVAGESKITGDSLAHFAAFLRRDWRSNDILWGRLDSIAEVIESYLDGEAFDRLRQCVRAGDHGTDSGRLNRLDELFKQSVLYDAFPAFGDPRYRKIENQTTDPLSDSLQQTCDNLAKYWQALKSQWRQTTELSYAPRKLSDSELRFRDTLIRSFQYNAFLEELPRIQEDFHFQEITWGRCAGSRSTTSESLPASIECDALQMIQSELVQFGQHDIEALWQRYKNRGIGDQSADGGAYIPTNIAGEYLSQSYLMAWEMVRRSVSGTLKSLLDKSRPLLRGLPAFIYITIRLLRQQTQSAALYIGVTETVLLSLGAYTLIRGTWRHCIPLLIGALVYPWLIVKTTPRNASGRIRLSMIMAFIITAAVMVFAWALMAYGLPWVLNRLSGGA
jgi:patatin-related protein